MTEINTDMSTFLQNTVIEAREAGNSNVECFHFLPGS